MDLSIEKKNQRKLAAKKRLLIHQSFNNRFVNFNKLLQKIKWFKEGKIIASFLSIKTDILISDVEITCIFTFLFAKV